MRWSLGSLNKILQPDGAATLQNVIEMLGSCSFKKNHNHRRRLETFAQYRTLFSLVFVFFLNSRVNEQQGGPRVCVRVSLCLREHEEGLCLCCRLIFSLAATSLRRSGRVSQSVAKLPDQATALTPDSLASPDSPPT